MVRGAAAAVMIEKYRIDLTCFTFLLRFFAPFLLPLLFCNRRGLPYDIDQIDSARHGTILVVVVVVVAAAATAATTTTTHAFDRTAPLVQRAARVTEHDRGIESIPIPRHDTRVVQGYQIIIDTVARYNSSNSNSNNTQDEEDSGCSNKLAQAAAGLPYNKRLRVTSNDLARATAIEQRSQQ